MPVRPYLVCSAVFLVSSLAAAVSCSSSPGPGALPTGPSGGGVAGAVAAAGGAPAIAGAAGMPTAGAPAGGTSGSNSGSGASGGGGGSSGTSAQAGSGGQPAAAFTWPTGKTAAVSLTYDDGLDGQLVHAIPLLDQKGIKATFFIASFPGVDHDWALPNASNALSARQQAWVAVGSNGHELAGHTVNHPCVTAINPGQAAGFLLDKDYDLTRIKGELDDTLIRIARLGAAGPLTFAYPCYSDAIGVGPSNGAMVTVIGKQLPQGTLFTSEVSSRFMAARGSTEAIANPATVDLHAVPYMVAGPRTTTDSTPTLAQLTAVVDMAIAQHGWVVFLIHGVAGDTLPTQCDNGLTYAPQTCIIDYLDTPTATHDGLVNYLAGKPEVWTTTFKAVATHIKTQRGL